MLNLNTIQNAVLIDAAGLSSTFSTFEEAITPLQLQDVFNLIDQIILRDRVIVVGPPKLITDDARRVLDMWLREGAMWLPKTRTPAMRIAPQIAPSRQPDITALEFQRVIRSLDRLAGAESHWQLPGLPLGHQERYYTEIIPKDFHHPAILDPVAQFHEITQGVENILTPIDTAISGLVKLALPPLPLHVFKRIDRIEQIPSATLELRHSFQSFRIQLRGLAELLRDDTRSDAEKIREVCKWQTSWKNVQDSVGSRSYRFRIGSALTPKMMLSAFGIAVSPPTGLVAAASVILPTILDAAATAVRAAGPKRFLFRPVYEAIGAYTSSNSKERHTHIQRIVGTQLEASRHRAKTRPRFGLAQSVDRP